MGQWVGCDGETSDEQDKDCIEKGFQLTCTKLDRGGEGAQKVKEGGGVGWGVVVLLFEMKQN